MGLFTWIKNLFRRKQDTPIVSSAPKDTQPIHTPTPSATTATSRTGSLQEYADDYARAVILPEWHSEAYLNAAHLLKFKDRFEALADQVNIPWYVPAVIQKMESGAGSFDCYLGNGEQIIGRGTKSKLVPKDRGPFRDWEEGALDALKTDRVASVKNWDIPNLLKWAESYNGVGYLHRGKRSPYLWSGTQLGIRTGKYVADGVYSETAVSKQIGICAVLKAMNIT
jgi:lysozyme family protein